MTLADAAVIMKQVAVLNGIARRRRETSRAAAARFPDTSTPVITSADEDECPAEPEIIAPLKVACDCAGHYIDLSE